MIAPRRGEIWLADLDPARGHEQAGRRPVLIISHDSLNRGPAGVVISLPITRTLREVRSHVRLVPPQGGLRSESAVLCENVKSISRERLIHRIGRLGAAELEPIERVLRILLSL